MRTYWLISLCLILSACSRDEQGASADDIKVPKFRADGTVYYEVVVEEKQPSTTVYSQKCGGYVELFEKSENPSRFLAQAEQESSCNPMAKSPFAVGLMQFTPQTADWVEDGICRSLGKARLRNARWSAKCGQLYMKHLEKRTPTTGEYCDTKRNAERAYNGGGGWIQRESKLTTNHSYKSLVKMCVKTKRSAANCKENTSYAEYISRRQKTYLKLGGKAC